MKIIKVNTDDRYDIGLGCQGENLARTLEFDVSEWRAEYGEGTVQLLHRRSGDRDPYPAAIEQEGDVVRWPITAADTAMSGTGRLQLLYFVGETLVKQLCRKTLVDRSLGQPTGDVPEAQKAWVERVFAEVAKVTGMTARAVELPAGSEPTAEYANGVLTIGIPVGGDVSEAQIAQAVTDYLTEHPIEETDPTVPDWAKQPEKPSYTSDEVGALSAETLPEAITTALAQAKESGEFDGEDGAPGKDGNDGQPGKDGTSPVISVSAITGGHRITITDANGTKAVDVMDGSDGKNGADGRPGQDGSDGVGIASIKQTATSTADGGDNVFTVTLTNGTSATFTVKNGRTGSTGATGADGQPGADGKSAYQYAQEGGYTGTETEFAAKLAEEMPDKLPNPNALTFTGAVTGAYDGSEPLTVEIPSGGGGGITGFRRVVDTTLTEAAEIVNLTTDINGNTFRLSECYLFIDAACTEADAITYIPNGYWAPDTYMVSKQKTATDYPYNFTAYACGGSDHFFGFELRHRTGASMNYYNSNKSANWYPITSYKLSGKFAKGARFVIFGRDA